MREWFKTFEANVGRSDKVTIDRDALVIGGEYAIFAAFQIFINLQRFANDFLCARVTASA